MKVYRLCELDEIYSILAEKNFESIGKQCEINKEKNNHKYNANKKYLHFFKDRSSLLYLNTKQGNFICVYDIPDDILKLYTGIDFYLDFINFKNYKSVNEFAIESEQIKFKYIKSIYMINKSFDLDDYIEDENLSKFLFQIYNKDNTQDFKNEKMIQLEKILTSDNIVESINNNFNYLLTLIPEIKDMVGFDHKHPHHHLDVWNHTLFALSLSENIFEIRLALLLHDIGKPHCFTEGEVRHFKGHPEVSSIMSKEILTRLGYNDNFINEVCYLVKNHDIPILKEEIYANYYLEYKRFLVQRCDAFAHNPGKLEKRKNYIEETERILKKSLKK